MSQSLLDKYTVINVNYLTPTHASSCGYCEKGDYYTIGFTAQHVLASNYQQLMDYGWRRCGNYYYVPADYKKSCCKMYTIRLNVDDYKIRKSHKKIQKKWINFLQGNESKIPKEEKKVQEPAKNNSQKMQTEIKIPSELGDAVIKCFSDIEKVPLNHEILKQIKILACKNVKFGDFHTNFIQIMHSHSKSTKLIDQFVEEKKDMILSFLQKLLPDYLINPQANGSISFKKQEAKDSNLSSMKIEKEKQEKKELQKKKEQSSSSKVQEELLPERSMEFTRALDMAITYTTVQNKLNLIDERLDQIEFFPCKKKKQGLFNTNMLLVWHKEFNKNQLSLPEFLKTVQDKVIQFFESSLPGFKVSVLPNGKIYFRKSGNHDKSELNAPNLSTAPGNPFKPFSNKEIVPPEKKSASKHKFTQELTPAKFQEDAYQLYKKYCFAIHNEKTVTKDSYQSFLCTPNLVPTTITNSQATLSIGCYHMRYYLDDKLFAVGVIDITEKVLSSVYFFYDPDYKKMNVGILGSLWEIDYIKNLKTVFPSFTYYYLGFYVHNCQKMSYKGDYEPSYLLCPLKKTWHRKDEVMEKVKSGENVLSSKETEINPDTNFSEINIYQWLAETLRLTSKGKFYKLKNVNENFQMVIFQVINPFLQHFGKNLIKSFVFTLD